MFTVIEGTVTECLLLKQEVNNVQVLLTLSENIILILLNQGECLKRTDWLGIFAMFFLQVPCSFITGTRITETTARCMIVYLFKSFCDTSEVVVIFPDVFAGASTFVRMMTQHFEPKKQVQNVPFHLKTKKYHIQTESG